MDAADRAYYEIRFELSFMQKKGDEFQDFFYDIMSFRYPGDFQCVRTWGNRGDQKCDGYLSSKQMVYQLYAPNELKEAETIKKINDDFEGASNHWADHMAAWTFVYNAKKLGPEQTKALLKLADASGVEIGRMGFVEIRAEIFQMNMVDIASILGPSPFANRVAKIEYEDVKAVTSTIAGHIPSPNPDLRPPPPDKIQINWLSTDTQQLIQVGMRGADTVSQFFADHPDPEFGDKIARAFTDEYNSLREKNLSPDEIYQKLYIFAGGQSTESPAQINAVFAILAHLFEECDIFERSKIERVQR